MLEREKTTRDCNALSLIKVFEKATSLGKRERGKLLGCNAEWLSPVVPMAPELTEELLVHQILARRRAKQRQEMRGCSWIRADKFHFTKADRKIT